MTAIEEIRKGCARETEQTRAGDSNFQADVRVLAQAILELAERLDALDARVSAHGHASSDILPKPPLGAYNPRHPLERQDEVDRRKPKE